MSIAIKRTYLILAILTVITAYISIIYGAVQINGEEMWHALQKWIFSGGDMTLNERIFIEIRLPRAILTMIVGASLSVGGVLMQGLFLNPIVEPGLIGTSSGAAFGAALYFTLGSVLGIDGGEWVLPIAACIGGFLATFLVYFLSENRSSYKKTSTVQLLLIGIAINALFLSGVGFLSYIARDPQARSITFWNLGTLSGANWSTVVIAGISCLICVLLGLKYAKQINALMLGEQEAGNLGIQIKTLKIKVLLINVTLVSVATAFTGIIGFVGLVVPHVLRILGSSNTRFLILASLFAGAVLLSAADVLSRLLIAPAELPVGIVTTLVGVPVFIYLLKKNEYNF